MFNTIITQLSTTSLKFNFVVKPSQNIGGEVLDANGQHQPSTIYIKLNFPQITFGSATIFSAKLISTTGETYALPQTWTSHSISGNSFIIKYVDLYLTETSLPNKQWTAGSEYSFEVQINGFSALPTVHEHFFTIYIGEDSTSSWTETGYGVTIFQKAISTTVAVTSLTKQAGEVTELKISLTQPNFVTFGPTQALYVEFVGPAWNSVEVIRDLDTTIDMVEMSCSCDQGGTIRCFRHLKRTNWYGHAVSINFGSAISTTTSVTCYVPEIKLPAASSSNWYVGLAVVDP